MVGNASWKEELRRNPPRGLITSQELWFKNPAVSHPKAPTSIHLVFAQASDEGQRGFSLLATVK